MRTEMSNTYQPGDLATWLYEPRGGYGYIIPVDAEVVRVTGKRVRVRVRRVSGEMVERTVTEERLRPRPRKAG
jgi:hypothetical protein